MEKKYLSREECKSIQVKILSEIAKLCEQNQLTYYLAYGTLLGAVRHKGFIPWDDDIDIFLNREDYEKLIKTIKSSKKNICKWLEVIDNETDGYFYLFAKAIDNRTYAKMEDNVTIHGVWVDIFPVDGLPQNKYSRTIFILECIFLRAIILSMTTDFSANNLGGKGIIKRILSSIASLIGKKIICEFAQKKIQKYKNEKTVYVACLSTPYGLREITTRNELFQTEKFEFEDRIFTGPKEWAKYLSRLYGDYMKLPPEDKRKVHRITAWMVE